MPTHAHAGSRNVDILAVQSPPMAMENAEAPGAVLELTLAAIRRAGMEPQLRFIPWRRAQEMVVAGKDMLITPVTWLPSRDGKFTWIAPVCRIERAIASLKAPIDSLEQAMAERRTLVVGAGSAQEQQLRDMGYPAELISTPPLGSREADMLASGRVDGWYGSTLHIRMRWQQEGRGLPLHIGRKVADDEIFLACSRDCSPSLVAALRTALESLQEDGTRDRILARYSLSY
ncbi:substrate-binding periplasmic protein [Niveispirillum fermenti]|uniref:substrate-binding periplasmic protein n=1 Tax=Niveispirillum fermenti TaxID=1233113 RepID=UPI003A8BAD5C